jgi:hypothetical protein
MFSAGRKNAENFGQEIALGNLSRKFMNIVRLALIFLLAFILSFTVFLILKRSEILPQLKNMAQYFPSLFKKKEVIYALLDYSVFYYPLVKSIVLSAVFTAICHFIFVKIGKNAAEQEILDGGQEETIESFNNKVYKWTIKWINEEKKRIKPRYDFFTSMDLGAADKETKRQHLFGQYIKLGEKSNTIFIPEDVLKTHLGTEGATGTGKTVLINSVLEQIRNHNKTQVCVLDYNGQFFSKFGRPNDKILSINDKRAVYWHPWVEKITPEKIANSLIEDDPKDKFFAPAAKSLFSNLMMLNNNIEDFWDDLTRSKEDLFNKLNKYKLSSAGDFEGSSGNQGAGVRRTMTLSLDALRSLTHWTKDKAEFSIVEWAKNGSDDWIFIIVREEDMEAAKPWLRLWMDLVVSAILMRDENVQNNATWLIADELPLLGKLPSLQKGITNGRKYNFRVLIGYQSEGQIDEVYDKDAKGIKNSIRSKFIFNPGDPESAVKSAEILGKKEIYDRIEAETFSAGKDSIANNNQVREKYIVHPTVLRQLDKMECYLKLMIFNPVKLKIPLKAYPRMNKPLECENAPRIELVG